MSGEKKTIITINREYGAGGRSLASILSDRLGIPYYDQEFVVKTMAESGYDEEVVEREGEEMSRTSQVLNNFLNSSVSYSSSYDAIYAAEKKVILKLVEEPCIIVGRCANMILKEAGIDTMSIYLHAPMDKRLNRAIEIRGEGEEPTAKLVEDHDKKRRTFYKQYTGSELYDASNYTFCFDVGKISIPQCADIILGAL